MAHNKSLYELPSFWLALFIPLAVAGAVASWIAWHSLTKDGYSVCVSSECINGALAMMKLPLGILALVFPSVALIASHHRSVQTAAQIARADQQISLTESKNNFENSIKHREYFNSELEKIEKQLSVTFKDKDELYRWIFPLNDFSYFNPWADEMPFTKKDFEERVFRYDNYFDYVSSYFNHIEANLNSEDLREASRDMTQVSSWLGLETIGSIDLRKRNLFAYLSIKKIYPVEIVLDVFRIILNVHYMLRAISLSKNKMGDNSDEYFQQYLSDTFLNYYTIYDKPVFRSNGLGDVEEVVDFIDRDDANARVHTSKTTQWEREVETHILYSPAGS